MTDEADRRLELMKAAQAYDVGNPSRIGDSHSSIKQTAFRAGVEWRQGQGNDWDDAWEALQRWSDLHSRMEWLRLMDHLQEALSSEEMTPVSFERCMSGLLTKGPRAICEAIVAWKGTKRCT